MQSVNDNNSLNKNPKRKDDWVLYILLAIVWFAPGLWPFILLPVGLTLYFFYKNLENSIFKKAKGLLVGALVSNIAALAGVSCMFLPDSLPLPTSPIYFLVGGLFFTLLFITLASPISKKEKGLYVAALVSGTASLVGALGMFAPGKLPFTLPVAPIYFFAVGALVLLLILFVVYRIKESSIDKTILDSGHSSSTTSANLENLDKALESTNSYYELNDSDCDKNNESGCLDSNDP